MSFGSSFRLMVATALMLCSFPFPGETQETLPGHMIRKEGIRPDFQRFTRNYGFALGPGMGTRSLGGSEAHDLVLLYGHWGWIISEEFGSESWWGGRFELRAEVFGGAQVEPETGSLGGILPMLRYYFVTSSRSVPFAEAGVGALLTDIGEPDLSTTLQFSPQLGAGLSWFLREDIALTLGLRGVHISNAGIKKPNGGVNTLMVLIGVSWF